MGKDGSTPTVKKILKQEVSVTLPVWAFICFALLVLVFKVLVIIFISLHYQDANRLDEVIDGTVAIKALQKHAADVQDLKQRTSSLQEASDSLQNTVNANFADALE